MRIGRVVGAVMIVAFCRLPEGMSAIRIQPVVVMLCQRDLGLTSTGAFLVTEIATLHRALHMVVMAVLREANFMLKAKHLCPVLAE